tara:strand:- start:986 stop:1228 length:243 start_codon:yes stop_codon:yes gene_type:complete
MDDELMDMMVADDSASQVSDKMKDILFAKSAERVDAYRQEVANSLFGSPEVEVEDEVETEVDAEADIEVEDEVDTEEDEE